MAMSAGLDASDPSENLGTDCLGPETTVGKYLALLPSLFEHCV